MKVLFKDSPRIDKTAETERMTDDQLVQLIETMSQNLVFDVLSSATASGAFDHLSYIPHSLNVENRKFLHQTYYLLQLCLQRRF